MKNIKITLINRVLLTLSGLALLIVLFVPLWRIDLVAPQYPEGLRMQVYANKLGGNVDIINGLNHYIGMKTLHESDFPEFAILPWIIIFFSVMLIVTAIAGSRKLMNVVFILFVAFGVVAMIDFWRWEYDYGHNLNPDAAIIVPGMAYQPPLIGFKQLLNFGAYSFPDIGGWIFVAVGIILLFAVIVEWRRMKKSKMSIANSAKVMVGLMILFATGCSTGPQPIVINKDNCSFCKMPISDNRFGAEIISKKGKVFKFDDTHCTIGFIRSDNIDKNEIGEIYFTNFMQPHELINLKEAHFLQSPGFRSPMNGNVAAFNNEDSLEKTLPKFYGNKISWEEMLK